MYDINIGLALIMQKNICVFCKFMRIIFLSFFLFLGLIFSVAFDQERIPIWSQLFPSQAPIKHSQRFIDRYIKFYQNISNKLFFNKLNLCKSQTSWQLFFYKKILWLPVIWKLFHNILEKKEKYCPAFSTHAAALYVTLRVPTLDSLTGWTGQLWSKTDVFNLQKLREQYFFAFSLSSNFRI